MNTEIITSFTNKEYGITAFITKGATGFHVSLRDDDANEFVATVIIFKTLELAIAKAKEII